MTNSYFNFSPAWCLFALIFCFSEPSLSGPIPLSAFNKKPKLILVLVVDQLRPDMLTLNQKSFLPAKTKSGSVGGYNYLMSEGAFFPLARYDILQSMTCPGHAMILSGTFPHRMKIPINEWHNRKTGQMTYCVDDPSVEILGSTSMSGMSPKNFNGSTLTDEIKNAGIKNKTFAVAIKDRGAILLGGPQADLATWFSPKEMTWVSSSFYLKDKTLPKWIAEENSKIQKQMEKLNPEDQKAFKNSIYFTRGNDFTVDISLRGLKELNLGKSPGTDLLAVSFSSHDYTGHRHGPNSKQIFDITVHEDQSISRLLNAVQKQVPGGLSEVLIVLTSDHGVAPDTEFLKGKNLPSGLLDQKKLVEALNQGLENKFGKSSSGTWVQSAKSLNFYLNRNQILKSGQSLTEFENLAAEILLQQVGVEEVLKGSDFQKSKIPPGLLGQQLKNTYDSQINGDLILIPKPFFYEMGNLATHMTGYHYDGNVPLIFVGRNIKKGVYAQESKIVDIAPTLSFVLGISPPAMSEGRVLSEIF